MADSSSLPVARLLDGLAEIVELANSGGDGLPGLRRIVELAQSATSAVGATYLAYVGSEGRVVAATGAAGWSLGRLIETTDPAVARVLAGPPVQELTFDELPRIAAPHLRGHGVRRALRAASVVDGTLTGALQVYFADESGHAGEYERAVVRLLADCAGGLRADHRITGAPPQQRVHSEVDTSARDIFVAVASHELRTPVTVIRGYADTLVGHWDSLDEGERRQAIEVIGQRARELARLVDRLLHAATAVAGRLDTDARAPFDLPDALRAGLAELNHDLRRGLRIVLPDVVPKALGDRASLTTVLTELVTNAYKYSPDVVDVEVSAGSDEQSVWFRVADRGSGIPPEHAERAFERFWQLEPRDPRRYGGVGLGLYLVRKIVDRQNGWVSLRPRDGGGVVVEVRLPRADAEGTGQGA